MLIGDLLVTGKWKAFSFSSHGTLSINAGPGSFFLQSQSLESGKHVPSWHLVLFPETDAVEQWSGGFRGSAQWSACYFSIIYSFRLFVYHSRSVSTVGQFYDCVSCHVTSKWAPWPQSSPVCEQGTSHLFCASEFVIPAAPPMNSLLLFDDILLFTINLLREPASGLT